MSEQMGLILGLIGTIFFWRFISQPKSLAYGFLSLNTLVLAELVRPGNLLVPLVPAITILFQYRDQILKQLFRIILSISSIYLAIFSYASIFASKGFMTGGNSWGTIYGLIKNNSSYDVAYVDLYQSGLSENDFWGLVRTNSIAMIKDEPFTFLKNIFSNGYEFYSLYFFRILGLNYPSSNAKLILNLLICVILFVSINKVRKNVNSFLDLKAVTVFIFLFLTEFCFYGISLYSDPVRAMSTSAIFFLSYLFILVFPAKVKRRSSPTKVKRKSKKGHEVVAVKIIPIQWSLAPTFLLILIMALTPIGLSKAAKISPSCELGNEKIETNAVIIRKKSEIKNFVKDYWWLDPISKMPPGIFIEGFTYVKYNKIESRSLYVIGSPRIPKNGAICIAYSDEKSGVLENISFKSAKIVAVLPS
jgi:hypothetical protein